MPLQIIDALASKEKHFRLIDLNLEGSPSLWFKSSVGAREFEKEGNFNSIQSSN